MHVYVSYFVFVFIFRACLSLSRNVCISIRVCMAFKHLWRCQYYCKSFDIVLLHTHISTSTHRTLHANIVRPTIFEEIAFHAGEGIGPIEDGKRNKCNKVLKKWFLFLEGGCSRREASNMIMIAYCIRIKKWVGLCMSESNNVCIWFCIYSVSTVWQFKLHILFHFIALCDVEKTGQPQWQWWSWRWWQRPKQTITTMLHCNFDRAALFRIFQKCDLLFGCDLHIPHMNGCKRPNEFLIVL